MTRALAVPGLTLLALLIAASPIALAQATEGDVAEPLDPNPEADEEGSQGTGPGGGGAADANPNDTVAEEAVGESGTGAAGGGRADMTGPAILGTAGLLLIAGLSVAMWVRHHRRGP